MAVGGHFCSSIMIMIFIMPPFEKGGHIALQMSVCRSVSRSVRLSVGMSVFSLNLVQLITREHFEPEASNLVSP